MTELNLERYVRVFLHFALAISLLWPQSVPGEPTGAQAHVGGETHVRGQRATVTNQTTPVSNENGKSPVEEPLLPAYYIQNTKQAAAAAQKAGKLLDEIEKHIQKWGHGSVAMPELIDPLQKDYDGQLNRDRFQVDYDGTYDSHETEIRKNIQGAASQFVQGKMGIRIAADSGSDAILEAREEAKIREDEIYLDRLERANELDQIAHETQVERAMKLQAAEREIGVEDILRRLGSESGETDGASPAPAEKEQTPLAAAVANLDPNSVELLTPAEGGVSLPISATSPSAAGGEPADPTPAPESLTPKRIGDRSGDGTERNGLSDPEFGGVEIVKSRVTAPDGTVTETLDEVSGENFAPFQSLVDTSSISLSEPDIIKLAASSNMTGNIIGFASGGTGLAPNKKAFLAISQVSVSPGWYSREGFFCEVQLRANYADANGNPDIGGSQPSILAAFPFADSQTLDLKLSERRQFELIMDLASQMRSAGQLQNANAILKFAKRLERDLATRNALPVVVPSSDGTQVTYRFNPQFQALGDPTDRKSKASMVLQATSIPVMTLLIVDKSELDRFPKIEFSSTTRWIPTDKRPWLRELGYLAVNLRPRNKRLTQEDSVRAAVALDETFQHVDALDYYSFVTGNFQNSTDYLTQRFENIEPLVKDYTIAAEIPRQKADVVQLDPGTVVLGKTKTLRALLEHGREVKAVSLNGVGLSANFDQDSQLLTMTLDEQVHADLSGQVGGGRLSILTDLGYVERSITLRKEISESPKPKFAIKSVSPSTVPHTTTNLKSIVIRGDSLPLGKSGDGGIEFDENVEPVVLMNGQKFDTIKVYPKLIVAESTNGVSVTPGSYFVDVGSPYGYASLENAITILPEPKPEEKTEKKEQTNAEILSAAAAIILERNDSDLSAEFRLSSPRPPIGFPTAPAVQVTTGPVAVSEAGEKTDSPPGEDSSK